MVDMMTEGSINIQLKVYKWIIIILIEVMSDKE
jgi:hypothetical protein